MVSCDLKVLELYNSFWLIIKTLFIPGVLRNKLKQISVTALIYPQETSRRLMNVNLNQHHARKMLTACRMKQWLYLLG